MPAHARHGAYLRGYTWFILPTQDRWPAAAKNIFCLREEEASQAGEILREVERVDIPAMLRIGIIAVAGEQGMKHFLITHSNPHLKGSVVKDKILI